TLQDQLQSVGDSPLDNAQVESQVEILRSDNIGLAVIKKLKLTDDPEFGATAYGWLSPWNSAAKADDKARQALAVFLRNRSISRVGRTYVLDIAYTSLSPATAAAAANAIADAYIMDQLDAKYQTTQRASAWLQDRLHELTTQATAADLAVLEFKEKNKIVDLG